MVDEPVELAFQVVAGTARELRAALTSPRYLAGASAVTKDKGGGHLAHRIDQVAEANIFRLLREREFSGTVFSEETGSVKFGSGESLFVTDPYCNTSLTFRGIRASAVTGFEFDSRADMISAAIADVQVWRTLAYSRTSGSRIVWEDGTLSQSKLAQTERLSQALVVMSLLKRKRRDYLASPIARECDQLLTVDGGIVALRICSGEVDAFVDHQYGQPAYESLPYCLVELSGGVVTDGKGEAIDWVEIAAELCEGRVRRQTIVAACTVALHDELLSALMR